jgi:hypothetical protein
VMRGRLDARRTLKSLVADLRVERFFFRRENVSLDCREIFADLCRISFLRKSIR